MSLVENVTSILRQIEASEGTNHSANTHHITVVGVTKYVDVVQAKALVAAGIGNLGENRVDLFLEKYYELQGLPITWHLIGTLQRRKVKDVINLVDYFHALSSVKLAQEINKRAEHVIKCFLQLNISCEVSKHGFLLEELPVILPEIAKLSNIQIVGIMTMGPKDATDSERINIFDKAKEIQENISCQKIPNMPCTELSMGMSQDFQQAIKHGATVVRIGSKFFN